MALAIVYTAFGGPEVLHLTEIEEPTPAPGKVVVRVEAAGVNPIDAKLRGGLRASSPITSPRRVGTDGAGTVVAVPDDVDGFRVGDEVVFAVVGSYATHVAVSVGSLHHRPPQVSAAAGAAIGIPAGTAYQSLRSLDVRGDDTLLVHAGSGAVGQAAIQFAALWGARVVATCSPARFDRVRSLGAVPVAYGDGLEQRIREAAPEGITVALDAAGTDEALESSLSLVSDRNRIATIVKGAAAASLGIRAFSGGSPEPLTAQQQHWRTEAVPVTLALMAADAFSVELGPELPLAEAADAHRLVEEHVPGKITLLP